MSKTAIKSEIIDDTVEIVEQESVSKPAKLIDFMTKHKKSLRVACYVAGAAVTTAIVVKMNSTEETTED